MPGADGNPSLFAQAMRAGLQGTMRVKGLLEMMFEVLSDWIDAFIEDIEEVEATETGNTTPKGSISHRDSRGGCSFATVCDCDLLDLLHLRSFFAVRMTGAF